MFKYILSQNTCKNTINYDSTTSQYLRDYHIYDLSLAFYAIASFTLTAATNAAKAKHGFTILPATGLVSLKAL